MKTGTLGCALFATLALCLLLGGCGEEQRPLAPGVQGKALEAERDIARLDEHRTLGAAVRAQNLTVWPVFTDKPLDIGEFRTLQEAQTHDAVSIRERSASGEVDTVVVENSGDLPILVVAGTIIDGGKQDRQIGQDFVIAAGATVEVDAFCVEQGRWSGEGVGPGGDVAEFRSSYAAGIAPKVVRSAAQYEKDQGAVWANVDRTLHSNAEFGNDTRTLMGAIEKADPETKARRERIEETVRTAFERLAAGDGAPVGFAYAVNGKPVTVRTFAHARILRAQLPLFLKAMTIEALMAKGGEPPAREATARDVIEMVQGIEMAKEAVTRTRGMNDNGYRDNAIGFKARCVWRGADGRAKVVLTEDWTAR